MFDQIAATLGLSTSLLAAKLGIARRTLTRKHGMGTPLSAEVSEKVLRVARICNLARSLFATDQATSPSALSGLNSHCEIAWSVAKSERARLHMRATRSTFSQTPADSGVPMPCFRVSVRRAIPSLAARSEVERPRVAAIWSNMLAGSP